MVADCGSAAASAFDCNPFGTLAAVGDILNEKGSLISSIADRFRGRRKSQIAADGEDGRGPALDAARAAAAVELLPAQPLDGVEAVAFDVIVDGRMCGHWTLKLSGEGVVSWSNPPANNSSTGPCGQGDPAAVAEAVRSLLPPELALRGGAARS